MSFISADLTISSIRHGDDGEAFSPITSAVGDWSQNCWT
jgi:hypothetical protein